jgi:hypothetical protein
MTTLPRFALHNSQKQYTKYNQLVKSLPFGAVGEASTFQVIAAQVPGAAYG